MTFFLWLSQLLLGITFFLAGAVQLGVPQRVLAGVFPWTVELGPWQLRGIGALELLAGLGLLLPMLASLPAALVPLSALVLAGTMLAAALFHGRRGETGGVLLTVLLMAALLWLAWQRFAALP